MKRLIMLWLVQVGMLCAGEARADDKQCCVCTGDETVNPADRSRKPVNGGWLGLGGEGSCIWYCLAQTQSPSHTISSADQCSLPALDPPPVKVAEYLEVCWNWDTKKNKDNFEACNASCASVQSTRDMCVEDCGTPGCRAACSGGCNTEGCQAGCAGAEEARQRAFYTERCSIPALPCDRCVDELKKLHDQCVNRYAGDKGWEDWCHGTCKGEETARNGVCNERAKSCPAPTRPPWKDSGPGGSK